MCPAVPPSDASDTDDHDSVHSLPVGSGSRKREKEARSVSSGHTPQVPGPRSIVTPSSSPPHNLLIARPVAATASIVIALQY